MPLTVFYCAECDKEFSRFRSLSQIPEGAPCPQCNQSAAPRKSASQASAEATADDNLPELT